MEVRKQMQRFRVPTLLALVALLAAAVVIVGCGSSSSSTGGESTGTGEATTGGGSTTASEPEPTSSVTKIAIATPAKDTDYGWNEQGVDAATEVAEENGAEIEANTDLGYEQTESVLRQMAAEEPSLLISHASGYDTVAKRIAEETGVPTVTTDIATNVEPGKLTAVTFAAQEGAYLAGVLAAKTTKTGTVGVIVSATNTNWYNMAGGYAAGVHSVDPSMPISFAQISAEGYDDSAGGKRVATSMIAEGADVILGLGDDSSFGYLQAIESANVGHKVYFINAIGDMTPIDKKGVILSSVIWNLKGAYQEFVKELNDGTFGEEPYELTLANGGFTLLKTKNIPAKVYGEVEAVEKEIIAGTVEVPESPKIDEVKAALEG